MSSIKDHLFNVESQRVDEWVRERLSDDSLDEDSEEYLDLANDYSDYQEHLYEMAEWEAELKWFKDNGSSEIHARFLSELDSLEKMVQEKLANQSKPLFIIHTDPFIKMSYAYAVTLLESFLGDTLKTIISGNHVFLKNAISKFKKLKGLKLSELSDFNLNINSLVIKHISGVLFHNIPDVIEMYEQVLNIKLDIDISKIMKITKLRHDIAHRNGRTIDGEDISIRVEDIILAINDIKTFSSALQKSINGVLEAPQEN